jgi:hypothetical protein
MPKYLPSYTNRKYSHTRHVAGISYRQVRRGDSKILLRPATLAEKVVHLVNPVSDNKLEIIKHRISEPAHSQLQH